MAGFSLRSNKAFKREVIVNYYDLLITQEMKTYGYDEHRVEPKLGDFQVCRPSEIGFAFDRAGIYKEEGVSL